MREIAIIKKILLVVSLFLLLNLLGGVIITQIEPELDFINGFYLMMSTSTTVGFGNIAPESNGGKMFISFYQLALISFFFYIIGIVF